MTLTYIMIPNDKPKQKEKERKKKKETIKYFNILNISINSFV